MRTSLRMDHYFQTFFDYVALIHEMPPADMERCRQMFTPVWLPKGTLVSRSGEVPEFHNFVVSGHLRNYHIDEKGDEVTVDLNDGPRFFTSYYYFSQQIVSPENVECLTDCELLQVRHVDVVQSAANSLSQREYTIKLLELILEEEKIRINDMAILTAEQRYLKLVQQKPNIVKNVPLKYVASYLGIKPESLSRIRRELLNNC